MRYISARIILLTVCLCLSWMAVAQESEQARWTPELGMQLTSDLQVTHRGDFNFANVLRLAASLPVTGGLSVDISSLSTYMTSQESIGSDWQTYSNLDAERIPFILAMCGLNWQVNDHHSLFAGVRNMNEDYFCSPATSLFTNSSCGIYPTLSANYPMANYPLSSVGVHYKYESEKIDFQASIYNGRGYSHFAGRENIFRVCPQDDGVYGITDVQYRNNGSLYFLGCALRCDNGVAASPWVYAEQALCRNLTLLACFSHAFGKDMSCSDFAGVGVRYLWGRSELGVFTDFANFDLGNEFATELTGKIHINQHLFVQPSAHFAFTDGTFQTAAALRMGVEW